MAVYTFETIGAAEALSFNPSVDKLVFSTPGASASNISMGVDWKTGNISLTLDLTGRSVVFHKSFFDQKIHVTFADGSRLGVGPSVEGHSGRDLLIGSSRTDVLSGGAGDDTLVGGSERDELVGGEGRDLFIIRLPPPHSPLFTPDGALASTSVPMASIADWSAEDSLSFGGVAGSVSNFAVLPAFGYLEPAAAAANALIAEGAIDFVAVVVGSALYVFADSKQDNGYADSAVYISGVYADGVGVAPKISAQQIVASQSTSFVSGLQIMPPDAPARPLDLLPGEVYGNMDSVMLSSLQEADIRDASDDRLAIGNQNGEIILQGAGLTYDDNYQIKSGNVSEVFYRHVDVGNGSIHLRIKVPDISPESFGDWLADNANDLALRTLFSGNQLIQGGGGTDLIRGYGGDDVIFGGDARNSFGPTFDSLFGGDGNDQIFANRAPTTSPTFMRGEAGNDYMVGSGGFDNMHGNQGNDTVIGGGGNDWVVGGQNDDMLFGQVGDDIVNGNMGNDTCVGGDGADIVRGGQHDDYVYGDAGNDWLSGDRGDDVLTGGSGADIFYAMRETGRDRVTDFRIAEGDRVQLEAGARYTVYQAGADTVIDLGGGNQLVLVGVNMAELTTGWMIFG